MVSKPNNLASKKKPSDEGGKGYIFWRWYWSWSRGHCKLAVSEQALG